LHAQLRSSRDQAPLYRRQFNFALLAEEAHKRFGYALQRNSSRRFARRPGDDHQRPEEQGKVSVRFARPGPGIRFQHEAARHCGLPALGGQHYLLLTQADDSRRVGGALLVSRATSGAHRQGVRQTVQAYGRPLAYDGDNHSLFRWVTHQSDRDTVTTAEAEARVQCRRALRSLDMGILQSTKGEPEGRGKIDKRFAYFQRRRPVLCAKYRVQACAEGNRSLAEAVAYDNAERVHLETGESPTRRWEEAVAAAQGRLRPLPEGADWREIVRLHLERTVGTDGTFPCLGQRWALNRALHRHRVQRRWLPRERLWGLQGGHKVGDVLLSGDALRP
jgi:hypothetical protein